MTLVAALSSHCRPQRETNSEFLVALKGLTAEDKEWYKRQFKLELGITIE